MIDLQFALKKLTGAPSIKGTGSECWIFMDSWMIRVFKACLFLPLETENVLVVLHISGYRHL